MLTLMLQLLLVECRLVIAQSKEAFVDTLRPFLDAKEISTLPDNNVMVNPGVLPNPFLAAIVGALKLVARRRAPVLILDSASAALPNDLVKKTLWRIVSGKVRPALLARARLRQGVWL